MRLAFCDECDPPAIVGLNFGAGIVSHAVGDRIHHAKILDVQDSPLDRQGSEETVPMYLDRLAKKYRHQFSVGTLSAAVIGSKGYTAPSFEVGGGLGDVLHSLHHTDKYSSLIGLGPNERRLVVLLSHNPHTQELFQWHPKAVQLDVLYLGYRHPWGAEQRAGLKLRAPMPDKHRNATPIEYYPGPSDREPLAALAGSKYVAFCLTGSANDKRDVPLVIAEQAADIAIQLGFEVVVLGRNYRTVATHGTASVNSNHVEPPLRARRGVTSMVDRLSVPGTCKALAGAKAVLCAHSALCLASWFMRRPTFVLYNEAQARLFKEPLGYAFGRDYRENRHKMHADFKTHQWTEFMGRVKDGDY